MIRISKKIEWIRNTVEKIIEKFEIRNLKEIRIYKPNRNRKQQTWGSNVAADGTFRIVLLTHSQPHEDRRRKLRKLTKKEILINLGHELAHCLVWAHSAKHDRLTKRISAALAKAYRAEK